MKTTQYLNLIAITFVFQNNEHNSSMTNFAFFPVNNSVDFVQKEKTFFRQMFEEAKTFPKLTKWESSSFAYYATVNQIEKKTFKQLMTATAFQVEKESIDERMTKEKHFHRVFQMHFGRTTCVY